MSYFASVFVRKVLAVDIFDATAGFKCYRRKVLEAIDLDNIRMKGYGFQIEMKYTAYRLGFKIKEVPIIFVDRKEGHIQDEQQHIRRSVLGCHQDAVQENQRQGGTMRYLLYGGKNRHRESCGGCRNPHRREENGSAGYSTRAEMKRAADLQSLS